VKKLPALWFVAALLAINCYLQCLELNSLTRDRARVKEIQKQEFPRWTDPHAEFLEDIRHTLVLIRQRMILALLIAAASMSLLVGLLKENRWAYKLAIIYATIAVVYSIFEVVIPMTIPPSILQRYIDVKDWVGVTRMLTRSVLYGLLLWCLLRPGVKAQFFNNSNKP